MNSDVRHIHKNGKQHRHTHIVKVGKIFIVKLSKLQTQLITLWVYHYNAYCDFPLTYI